MTSERAQTAGPAVLVWDGEGVPPEGTWKIALWRDFGAPGSTVYSVPKHLEERAEELRARFLAWVHDLGETLVGGKRLVDHLVLRPGFSFWWMTLLAEKSNALNSLQIISVLKLMALEDLLGTEWRGRLILVSGDVTLARTFGLWCCNASMEFEWRRTPPQVARLPLALRLYRALPYPMQAFVALLRYLTLRWPLRGAGPKRLQESAAQATICSYLFNVDQAAAESGHLASDYWAPLHAAIQQESAAANWLLLFIAHDFVPTARQGRRLIDRFNEHGGGMQVHAALDGALGLRAVMGAVRDYFAVASAALRLRKVRGGFRPARSNINLWPLFEYDWRSSLLGSSAILNCVALNLFERTLRALPRQRLGVYLQENYGWEMAFTYCWKSAGHGLLVGAPHSTVRFWDLRYFFDPRSYRRTGNNDLPLADLVALNGPAAMNRYLHGGYPADQLVEVEALRYLHLASPLTVEKVASDSLRVLVLGDYLRATTQQQMKWLESAAALLPPGTRYVVKPHPACPIDQAEYPELKMSLTGLSIDKLLADCDVAYTSNMTSAAVDAYSAGVPVVSVLDPDKFNLSPLRGMAGVSFVTSFGELAQALARERGVGANRTGDYFCLDRRIPRWRRLLGLRESA